MIIPPRCRVVIDNDWAGDPDGLVALAHHLLSSANEVLAITGTANNPMFGPPEGTAEAGAVLARALAAKLGRSDVVVAGPDSPFDGSIRPSAAADALVAAVRSESDLPTFVVCGGPLTTVADALRRASDISPRFTLVWVGGSTRGDDEYNECTDQAAADFVFAQSGLSIHQFPLEAYRPLAISVVELEDVLGEAGATGRWLWKLFETLPLPDFVKLGPLWCLGDSAPLIVTALDDLTSSWETVEGDQVERRVYTSVDLRLILGDMTARLRAWGRAS